MNRRLALFILAAFIGFYSRQTYLRNMQWANEGQFIESHREAFPDNPEILTRAAAFYVQRGDYGKALNTYKHARAFEGTTSPYYRQQIHRLTAYNIGLLHLVLGNPEGAEWEARRAIAAKRDFTAAWHLLSAAQMQLGKREDAAKSSTEAGVPTGEELQFDRKGFTIPKAYTAQALFLLCAGLIGGLWIMARHVRPRAGLQGNSQASDGRDHDLVPIG